MEKLRKVSLFSGIEAFDMALRNIGISIETLALSEINQYSITSCNAIHSYTEGLHYGDVTKFDGTQFKNVDILTHGSPCTSMSLEGKKDGADKDSGTASSLLWESVRIIKECLPTVVLWENVYTVTNKKNIHNFKAYLKDLEDVGYVNYHHIYEAVDFDTPQNRKRMVVVSIQKDSELTFNIPRGLSQTKVLKDILESNVDTKFDLDQKTFDMLFMGYEDDRMKVKNGTKQGYALAEEYDGVDFNRPESNTRRGRVQSQRSSTLLTSKTLGLRIGNKLRYFTPLEYWRLQGFSDEDYYKARTALEELNESKKFDVDNQLYFQAGNSIPVKILEEIFKEIYISVK